MKRVIVFILCVFLAEHAGIGQASDNRSLSDSESIFFVEQNPPTDDPKVLIPENMEKIEVDYDEIFLGTGALVLDEGLPEKAIPDKETAIIVAAAYFQPLVEERGYFSYNQKVNSVVYDEANGYWLVTFVSDLGEFAFSFGSHGIVLKESTGEFVAFQSYP